MGLFDSGGTVTTTQQSAPWSGQSPYLEWLYGQAQNLPQQQYFPGSTVVPQSPETLQALNLQSQRALSGSPVQTAGQNMLAGTLQGDYLYGGPGFNAAFDAAQRRITPAVQGQFEGAGRFGGGLAQEAETSALSDAFAGLYGQERNRQMQGLSQVPAMAALDYADIGALSNVGQQREAFAGQQLADQMNRWNFAQQSPYQQLEAQSNVIQAGYPGGTKSTENPYFNDVLGSLLGGALTGAGILDAFGVIGDGADTIGKVTDAAGNVVDNAGNIIDVAKAGAGLLGGLAPAAAGVAAANAGVVPSSLSGGGLGTAASAAIPTGGALSSGLAPSLVGPGSAGSMAIPSLSNAAALGTPTLSADASAAIPMGGGLPTGTTGMAGNLGGEGFVPGVTDAAGGLPTGTTGTAGAGLGAVMDVLASGSGNLVTALGGGLPALFASPYVVQSLFGSTGQGTLPAGTRNIGGGYVVSNDNDSRYSAGQILDSSGNVLATITPEELTALNRAFSSSSEGALVQQQTLVNAIATKYGIPTAQDLANTGGGN